MPIAGLAANPHEISDTGEQAVRAAVEQVMRAVVLSVTQRVAAGGAGGSAGPLRAVTRAACALS